MTLAEFSQAVLIYYAANMLLALALFRPGTKSFEQVMEHPVAQSRPALILVCIMHFLIPAAVVTFVHPKRIKWLARRATLPLRIWLARRRIEARIAGWPKEMQPVIRAQIAQLPPEKLPHIRINTPDEAIRAHQEANQKQEDPGNDR